MQVFGIPVVCRTQLLSPFQLPFPSTLAADTIAESCFSQNLLADCAASHPHNTVLIAEGCPNYFLQLNLGRRNSIAGCVADVKGLSKNCFPNVTWESRSDQGFKIRPTIIIRKLLTWWPVEA